MEHRSSRKQGLGGSSHLPEHSPVEDAIAANRLEKIGGHVCRYGLVLVLLWIGAMKFTAYEAEGIKPLVTNSPLMSWVYHFMSVTAYSRLLGVIEIVIALLIALRPLQPLASAVGSSLAAGMFVITLTFLITTPGWEPSAGGFPALSAMPGQFVLKDIVLLGVALWTAGEAWVAAQAARRAVARGDLYLSGQKK